MQKNLRCETIIVHSFIPTSKASLEWTAIEEKAQFEILRMLTNKTEGWRVQ